MISLMAIDGEPRPRGHHVTQLRSDLVGGIRAAVPILREQGLGSYDLQTVALEGGLTRVEIIGEPGRMDPVLEIANILEGGNVVEPDRAQQLFDLRDRIGRAISGMIENARNPIVQAVIERSARDLSQLRAGN